MGYALRYEVIDGACFVELPGDADLYGASEIRARISAFIASPERLVLDLSNLSITDETQLQLVVRDGSLIVTPANVGMGNAKIDKLAAEVRRDYDGMLKDLAK